VIGGVGGGGDKGVGKKAEELDVGKGSGEA
jgi:hypothetical protein